MQSWTEITYYAGFDWATDHHDVIIVNRSGQIVADFQIEHTAEGWQRWGEQVAALGAGVGCLCGDQSGEPILRPGGRICLGGPYRFDNGQHFFHPNVAARGDSGGAVAVAPCRLLFPSLRPFSVESRLVD